MNQPTRTGVASRATWSSASDPRHQLALELLLLLAVGALAAVLHQSFRWPIRMPGHHGLEWLAILMGARLLSDRGWAAFAVAGGAAVTALLTFNGHEGLTRPLTYLVQGAALDALYGLSLLRRPSPVWLAGLLAALCGALVHVLSPLIKTVLSFAAQAPHFGSLVSGLGFPLMTHAAFGAVGAAAGWMATRAWIAARQRSRH